MSNLAAQPAPDARFDDGCHRIGAQRIWRRLHRQRRASRKADTGMVARADLVVDAVTHTRYAFAALEFLGIFGAHTPLARELAFAVGDTHFQPALGGLHRLLQRLDHDADAVGAHLVQPAHTHGPQRLLNVHAGRRAGTAGGARRNILLTGGRGVTVLHDDQDAVALVEQIGRDAGNQSVVPESAVAHNGDGALLH